MIALFIVAAGLSIRFIIIEPDEPDIAVCVIAGDENFIDFQHQLSAFIAARRVGFDNLLMRDLERRAAIIFRGIFFDQKRGAVSPRCAIDDLGFVIGHVKAR